MAYCSLRVHLHERSYDIEIGRALIADAGARILKAAPARRALVLTDETVRPLYAGQLMASLAQAGCEAALVAVEPGEGSKRLAVLGHVYDALAAHGMGRDDLLIALGGGVVGDLGGFAAATYLRGIRYAQVPTTLLALVDSAVGGKTAIDLAAGKNLVGAFHQPAAVVADPDVLTTLSDRVFADGMAEVIKYALAFDESLLSLLGGARAHAQDNMEQIVLRCLDLKRRVVEADERDRGERMLLNLGHTLGHAIEAAQHFRDYTHGEAVAAGMHLIARLGERAGLTEKGTADRVASILTAWRLPTACDKALLSAMRPMLLRDKKHIGGALNIVVLERCGRARIERVDASFFEGVEQWLR
ncbi:MAG: 3-dehydroquinate synthase [Christensenellaceae bacterium]|nr:3-dehydroquinate synthase [Christensenellaceae bacterium]